MIEFHHKPYLVLEPPESMLAGMGSADRPEGFLILVAEIKPPKPESDEPPAVIGKPRLVLLFDCGPWPPMER